MAPVQTGLQSSIFAASGRCQMRRPSFHTSRTRCTATMQLGGKWLRCRFLCKARSEARAYPSWICKRRTTQSCAKRSSKHDRASCMVAVERDTMNRPSSSTRSAFPDGLAILPHLPNSMEWNPVNPPVLIHQTKRTRSIRRKFDRLKRNRNDPPFDPIEIAQFKIPAGKFLVPPNSIQQILYWNHDGFQCRSSCRRHNRKLARHGSVWNTGHNPTPS